LWYNFSRAISSADFLGGDDDDDNDPLVLPDFSSFLGVLSFAEGFCLTVLFLSGDDFSAFPPLPRFLNFFSNSRFFPRSRTIFTFGLLGRLLPPVGVVDKRRCGVDDGCRMVEKLVVFAEGNSDGGAEASRFLT
jgi:hypothetical protein